MLRRVNLETRTSSTSAVVFDSEQSVDSLNSSGYSLVIPCRHIQGGISRWQSGPRDPITKDPLLVAVLMYRVYSKPTSSNVLQAVLAEGQWLSDLELTEAEMERSVREASRAEALSHLAESTSHAPSRQRQPEKMEKHGVEGGSIAGPLGEGPGCEGKTAGVTTNVRLLLNMGFDYMRVLEAASLFDDDFENILCFLLDPGAAGGGLEGGRHKGKAALS